MTRDYFCDYVDSWCELIDLCQDNGCDICEDIVDEYTLDEYVDSDISGVDYGWRRIRDILDDIPTGYEYYRCDGTFDYVGLDDSDFDDYKSRVLDWMDENGLWDEDENDDENEESDLCYNCSSPSEPESAELPVEEEDFTVSDLMYMCNAELITIRQVMEQRKVGL